MTFQKDDQTQRTVVNDSLTTRHTAERLERALSTAHIQQKLEGTQPPPQKHGNTGGSGNSSAENGISQQQGAGEKK